MSFLSLYHSQIIEKKLSTVSNIPFSLVCSKLPKDNTQLDRTWRGRRKALGKLINELQLGPPNKADRIVFPQKRLSLTHSGRWSIAAGTNCKQVLGIGIDFEINKKMDNTMTRLFLNHRERTRLGNNNNQALRLWSNKEAIFKSDPDNHGELVLNYELCNPTLHSGRAFRNGSNKKFHYASLSLLEGVLSVAVCTGRSTR